MATKNLRRAMSDEEMKREAERQAAEFARTGGVGFGGEGPEMTPEDESTLDTKLARMTYTNDCEVINHVNDDGSIDCPKLRKDAIKKIKHFHNDGGQNKGCLDYATRKMVEYNNKCYGDGDFEYNEETNEWGEKQNEKFVGYWDKK